MNRGEPPAIRPFAPQDAEAVATLCEEMQAHYGVPCPPRGAIVADLRDLPPGVRLLVATGSEGVVGFASLSPIYPGPGLRRGLFLKELFVSSSTRGRGTGRALMAACAAAAVDGGYGRIDFTATLADARLMDFYLGLGAVPDPKRGFLRIAGGDLARLAEDRLA